MERDGRLRLVSVVEAWRLPQAWQALKQLGASPRSGDGATWCHGPDFVDGLLVEYDGELAPGPEDAAAIRVTLRGLGPAERAHSTAKLFEISMVVDAGSDDTVVERARAAMAEFVRLYSVEVRLSGHNTEQYLGGSNTATHGRQWPGFHLVAVHQALDEEIEGWQRHKVTGTSTPRPSAVARRDASGARVTVFCDAQYFLRRGDNEWFVLSLNAGHGGDVQVKVETAGMDEAWGAELLERVDAAIDKHGGNSRRKMTYSGEELEFDREFTWEELFLDPEMKSSLRHEVESFFERPDLYEKMRLPHRRGLLLHGAPGTGKTLLGKVLACQLADVAFLWVTAADVRSPESVRNIFEFARSCQRIVLFFEDLDLYASRRGGRYSEAPLGELLVQLDGMHTNKGMLVIATTNDLTAIEPALSDRPSRFDRLIEFATGSRPVRKAHLNHLLAPFGVDDAAIARILNKTDGLTGAQLQELALLARRRAVGRESGDIDASDLDAAVEQARKFKGASVGFTTGRADHESDFDDFA